MFILFSFIAIVCVLGVFYRQEVYSSSAFIVFRYQLMRIFDSFELYVLGLCKENANSSKNLRILNLIAMKISLFLSGIVVKSRTNIN